MKKRIITCKKIKELIRDEDMATKEYKQYGFNQLSNEEAGHAKFLRKLDKKRGC